ncbi:hypothetical protein CFOL_v3_19395, partial [Cephalotus follicularis]
VYINKFSIISQAIHAPCLIGLHNKDAKNEDGWVMIKDNNDDDDDISNTSSASSLQGSTSSSSDIVDDASSSGSCSTSNSSSGPLYELSELMAHLPIKRGLSKFYQGKSQSFTSLSRVTSLEDLAKKEIPYRRKLKACKSYGAGLDSHKLYTLPRAIISKRVSRSSSSSLSYPDRRVSFLGTSRPPLIPGQKNF